MNTDDFWNLIERALQVADPQNEASMMEALFWELTRLPDQDFFAWYRLQQAFMKAFRTTIVCLLARTKAARPGMRPYEAPTLTLMSCSAEKH